MSARKDIKIAFPLRGFIKCETCDKELTGSLSKGRSNLYPYYRCNNNLCSNYGKSIKTNQVHKDFVSILIKLSPKQELMELFKAIMIDVYNKRISAQQSNKNDLLSKTNKLDTEINACLDKLLKSASETVNKALEKRIEELEQEKNILNETIKSKERTNYNFETALKMAIDFMKNLGSNWENGTFEDQRLIIDLAFQCKITYKKDLGFGTVDSALPLKVFTLSGDNGSSLVEMPGFEPGSATV